VPVADEARVKLFRLVGQGDRMSYVYDFGDGWAHQLTVEKALAAEPGVAYPRCMSGQRACPPEDMGGPWGLPLHVLATGANAPGRAAWRPLVARPLGEAC
jgi:hypothetical protein